MLLDTVTSASSSSITLSSVRDFQLFSHCDQVDIMIARGLGHQTEWEIV